MSHEDRVVIAAPRRGRVFLQHLPPVVICGLAVLVRVFGTWEYPGSSLRVAFFTSSGGTAILYAVTALVVVDLLVLILRSSVSYVAIDRHELVVWQVRRRKRLAMNGRLTVSPEYTAKGGTWIEHDEVRVSDGWNSAVIRSDFCTAGLDECRRVLTSLPTDVS